MLSKSPRFDNSKEERGGDHKRPRRSKGELYSEIWTFFCKSREATRDETDAR